MHLSAYIGDSDVNIKLQNSKHIDYSDYRDFDFEEGRYTTSRQKRNTQKNAERRETINRKQSRKLKYAA
jgi:hypothetical protein